MLASNSLPVSSASRSRTVSTNRLLVRLGGGGGGGVLFWPGHAPAVLFAASLKGDAQQSRPPWKQLKLRLPLSTGAAPAAPASGRRPTSCSIGQPLALDALDQLSARCSSFTPSAMRLL